MTFTSRPLSSKNIWKQLPWSLRIPVLLCSYLVLTLAYGFIIDLYGAHVSPVQAAEDTELKYIVIHHTDITFPVQLDLVDKAHERRGYPKSDLGYFVAYHFFIGKDGSVVQTRDIDERTAHTRFERINMHSIGIVLAGNFNDEKPTEEQVRSLAKTVTELKMKYPDAIVIPHSDASPTICPGQNMRPVMTKLFGTEDTGETYMVSRYYTPVPGQERYYRPEGYEADFKVNCSGDCLAPADPNKRYSEADAYKVAACPPDMAFGTRLWIQGIGVVTCHDHGSAIKGKRIDIWAGIGMTGLNNILNKDNPSGELLVKVLP